MTVFPQLLRQVREAAGLSQNALGRRIDINPGTINRLETGEREPTGREQVLQLAGGIGLDAEQTNRLVASAGFAPQAYDAVGLDNPTLLQIAVYLGAPERSAAERATFLQVGRAGDGRSTGPHPQRRPGYPQRRAHPCPRAARIPLADRPGCPALAGGTPAMSTTLRTHRPPAAGDTAPVTSPHAASEENAGNHEAFFFEGVESPNGTIFPDVLIDRVMPHLSGAEFKVLAYVVRRTFGFKKESDSISLDQICNGITRRDGSVLDGRYRSGPEDGGCRHSGPGEQGRHPLPAPEQPGKGQPTHHLRAALPRPGHEWAGNISTPGG